VVRKEYSVLKEDMKLHECGWSNLLSLSLSFISRSPSPTTPPFPFLQIQQRGRRPGLRAGEGALRGCLEASGGTGAAGSSPAVSGGVLIGAPPRPRWLLQAGSGGARPRWLLQSGSRRRGARRASPPWARAGGPPAKWGLFPALQRQESNLSLKGRLECMRAKENKIDDISHMQH
jgi:hypothetical protein